MVRDCCPTTFPYAHTATCTLTHSTADNSGKKFDTGKAPTLRGCLAYFAKALTAVASVSGYGAKKYNNTDYAPNWKKVEGGLGRYSDADARHLLSEAVDGLYDPESHLLHAAHHAWNALARLELLLADNPLEQQQEVTVSCVTAGSLAGKTVLNRRVSKDRRGILRCGKDRRKHD